MSELTFPPHPILRAPTPQEIVALSKTGETFTHKGVSRERVRKQWEVKVWLNRHNRPVLAEAGFPVYELDDNQPF
jgi:hypothetical protein